MRVLMFGWEFPPHVSGGLGTACYGMTRALASRGTDILFVVPCLLSPVGQPKQQATELCEQTNRSGQPDRSGQAASVPPFRVAAVTAAAEAATASRLHLLSASDIVVSGAGLTRATDVSRQINHEISPEHSGHWGKAGATHLHVQPMNSSLFAYATSGSYRERIADTPSSDTDFRAPGSEAEQAGVRGHVPCAEHAAWQRAPVAGDTVQTGALRADSFKPAAPLQGGYGPDLMTEVYRYAEAAGALALREPCDVIHVHDWMTYPAGITAKRLTGKPLVAHIHATEYDRSGLDINREVARIEQAGMLAADRVVAVSHYTRELIMRRYGIPGDKIAVVHNAVTRSEAPAAYHVPSGCANEKRVLFMGRVTYQKGPEYFVEAAHLVLRRMPGVRFVMAGSGDMLSRMVRRVAQLRMGSRFHFTGFLKGGMVDQMYATSDLYVMPSVSEPFGIAPLEAMVYDTPVLLSRQSGVAEVVKNALKVDFWDIREMANKICAVLAYPRLAAAVVANCREELKSIKWENSADLLNAIYRTVCAGRG